MSEEQPRLTRIRIEGSASGEQELRDYMMAQMAELRAKNGGEWEMEPQNPHVQTTKKGYWASLTIRRTNLTPGEVKRTIK